MDFEYNNQYVPQDLLTVDEIGRCALEGSNDDGFHYVLIVRVSMGMATLIECGPYAPDVAVLPSGFSMSLNRMKFDARKVGGYINKWLNDKKKLTHVDVIPEEEAIEQFRDMKEYIRLYGDEVY